MMSNRRQSVALQEDGYRRLLKLRAKVEQATQRTCSLSQAMMMLITPKAVDQAIEDIPKYVAAWRGE